MLERQIGGEAAPEQSASLGAPDSGDYMRGALDSAGAVIYAIDTNFQIQTVNVERDIFARLNGGDATFAPTIIGTNLLDWIRAPDREETRTICEAVFRGELPRYERYIDCSTSDERLIYLMVLTPLLDSARSIIGATFVNHNVTQRQLLEEEITARNQELRRLAEQLRDEHTAVVHERRRVQALGSVIAAMNESLSVEAAVNALLRVAIDLMSVPAAAVYLLTAERDRFTVIGSQGLHLMATDARAFELSTSAAGHAIAQAQPLEIYDTAAQSNFWYPLLTDGQRPASLLALPITTSEGLHGVLEVYSAVPRTFDVDDRTLLTTLAASAGVALTNAFLFSREVRARKEAERLAYIADEQRARYVTTIGAMADGVWLCDRDGKIVTVNDAGLRMFCLSQENVIGKPLATLSDLFGISRGERRRLGLRVALQGHKVHEECNILLAKGGTRIVDIYANPLRDEEGRITGAVAVVRDITETRAMEHVQEDFLSIAAHELKTPITALKGYAQLALKRLRTTPDVDNLQRNLETINDQADRITGLVHKLLDVSRIHAGKLELQLSRFDLQELIEGVAERAQLIAPKFHITVRPHARVLVLADLQRLEQVLYNLLDNAVKYSNAGGHITVETRLHEDRVQVTVHDQGLGIPADKLPHIFDRWFQAHFSTHGDYGGMGLGLYICKEIVERHGGWMWATSPEAGGTVVGFAIPREPVGATV